MSIGKVFVYANTALIAGIAFGSFLHSHVVVVWSIGGLLVFLFFFLPTSARLTCAIAAGSFLVGALLVVSAYAGAQRSFERASVEAQETLSARVVSIETSDSRRFTIDALTDGGAVVRAYVFDPKFSEGDFIRIDCGEGGRAPALSQFVSKNITLICSSPEIAFLEKGDASTNRFADIRNALLQKIERALPSPYAELLDGILLGEKARLPAELDEAMKRTGTTHIAVLSGFNITVLAFVLLRLFCASGIGIRRGIPLSISAVWFFVLLTGGAAPAVRAGIMVTLVLVGKWIGRKQLPISSLCMSACAMLVLDPLLLGWSLSFQLSFFATVGVLYSERLSPRMNFLPSQFGIRDNVRTTFAATAMTIPLVAYAFGGISLITLVTNAIILPLVPVAMALGTPIVTLGWISSGASELCAFPAYLALRIIVDAVHWTSRLPFAYIADATLSVYGLVVWYAALAGILAIRRRDTSEYAPLKKTSAFAIVVYGCLFGIVALVCFSRSPSGIVVSFFDVGQGDAIHIRTDEHFDILIDGGPDETVLTRLGSSMPYFDRTIELVVLTHPHADHVTGLLSVLKKYDVERIWMNGAEYDSSLYEEFLSRVGNTSNIRAGEQLALPVSSGSAELTVLWPGSATDWDDINNTSIVLRLDYEGNSVLLMGDAERPVESELVTAPQIFLGADILKVGHQGSRDASSAEFLKKVDPSIAVISVGADNSYGHPSEETLESLERVGATTYQTNYCGTIRGRLSPAGVYEIQSDCSH